MQSLLAVGTKETKVGEGQIYVFGQGRVSVVLQLPRRASVQVLLFWQDRLICLDSKNDLVVFSLRTKQILTSYSPPGIVSAVYADPYVDFVLLGLQNGMELAYQEK